MTGASTAADRRVCADCATEIAPALLACPTCRRLVHSDRLRELASTAEIATREHRLAAAIDAWEQALALLPVVSTQSEGVQTKLIALRRSQAATDDSSEQVPDAPTPLDIRGRGAKWAGTALAFVALVVTKGKFLLLGLTKGSTVVSMLASLGVYWAAWGFSFAAGFIVSIYVHEMGHVAALRRYGVTASAPMFLPGLGAVIRSRHMPADARVRAQIGLAGPLWGLAAAVAAYAAFLITGNGLWGAIARVWALVNIFNLAPVWQLDGNRGFDALSSAQRFAALGIVVGAWWLTHDLLLGLLAIVVGAKALLGAAPVDGDNRALLLYASLVGGLGWVVAAIPPP